MAEYGHTLLLNADYRPLRLNPLSTVTWKHAVTLEWKGTADAISWYDEWIVRSPSIEFPIPSVMRSKQYINPKRHPKFCLRNLYLRDNYTCQYCLKQFKEHELTKDHVLPRSLGGKTNWENIVAACGPCNLKRGNDVKIRPHTEPWRPTVYELDNLVFERPIHAMHESWVPFLEPYWNHDKIIVKKY